MNQIQNIIEPSRLFLIWQRPVQDGQPRYRRVVGEIVRVGDEAVFRYLKGTPDYLAAEAEGFKGYPAFQTKGDEVHRTNNVLYAFTSRLASRKRGDFDAYLQAHRLPEDFSGSDFSLLAHTGARLPSDGFEVAPDLAAIDGPFEIIVEVAGARYQSDVNLDQIATGDSVSFQLEPNNPADADAVSVIHSAGCLGYVPKPYCSMLNSSFKAGKISGVVSKKNGAPERRLIYVMLHFTP